MTRFRIPALIALLVALVVALGVFTAPPKGASASVGPDGSVLITGVDLHDGMIAKWDSTYYLYGTMYNCGFEWLVTPTTFCGMGVSTASSIDGPWTAPTLLFSLTGVDPYTTKTWAYLCTLNGAGCFNPRMLRRGDGVYVLWFNSPATYAGWGGANAYNAMGCNGPAGPCGAEAGAPNGTSHKPNLGSYCGANGDFGIHSDGVNWWMICTKAGTASLEQVRLDQWLTNAAPGCNASLGCIKNLAGLTKMESPGAYLDPVHGWVMTYSIPNCGYCTSTGLGYATAPGPNGPWTAPVDLVASGVPGNGRRIISADSCGGQPRTISVVDGVNYELIDLWKGTRNEAGAGVYFARLNSRPVVGVAGDGGLFRGGFEPLSCQ